MTDYRPTELQCEAVIIAAALRLGWMVHGERTVRVGKGARAFATPVKGTPGFPDLVLMRPPVLFVVELKRRPNRPDPDQVRWIEGLRECGVDAEVVYVPDEHQQLLDLLARRD